MTFIYNDDGLRGLSAPGAVLPAKLVLCRITIGEEHVPLILHDNLRVLRIVDAVRFQEAVVRVGDIAIHVKDLFLARLLGLKHVKNSRSRSIAHIFSCIISRAHLSSEQ